MGMPEPLQWNGQQIQTLTLFRINKLKPKRWVLRQHTSCMKQKPLLATPSQNDWWRTIMHQALKFAITGVMAMVIHYGVYLILHRWMADMIAYTIGYGMSFVCNFLLTCVFTFRKRANIHRGIGFCLVHAINFCLQIGLLRFFLWIGIQADIAPLPVFCIAVPINFLLVRFVFKK